MRVAITGATGFIGVSVTNRLLRDGRFKVMAAVRSQMAALPERAERVEMGEMTPVSDWSSVLSKVDVVVHLAARVHVEDSAGEESLSEFRSLNVASTLNLARQAAAAGVSRFLFMSTVKVNGESGLYTEKDPPAPQGAYAISKHEAELGLRAIADETGIEVVIVRPPLVYGQGVKANFRSLIRIVQSGVPLPLGSIHNRRSLVALDNLVDFLVKCIDHPAAVNQTFLVSDGEDLSTTDLVRRLAGAMGRPARLFPLPAAVLTAGGALLGRHRMVDRLLGSLQVDISKSRKVLGWVPPITVDEGLRRAVLASERD